MRNVSPAPAHLGEVLELADELRPLWPAMSKDAQASGLTCEGDEGEPSGGEEQPTAVAEHPTEDQPGAEDQSFTDYDPSNLPDEVRPVYDATYKRLQADYTKKTQGAAEAVREAEQANLIIEALQDPQRAPAVLQELGVPIGEFGQDAGDEDFDYVDPNERIDALQAELAQRDELSHAAANEQAENAFVTEEIESLEDELNTEFSQDEIDILYLYADRYRDGQGSPDVKAAQKILDNVASVAGQRLAKTKSRAPRAMGKGTPAERLVELKDPEKRAQAMANAVEAARASSQ